jgi:hypothetical protein
MHRTVAAPLIALMALTAGARGQESQAGPQAAPLAGPQGEPKIGRYQMVAVPASQAQTFPEALLLDTATGRSWMLYHETGQPIQWLPLPFWAGKDRPITPLPPSAEAAGVPR